LDSTPRYYSLADLYARKLSKVIPNIDPNPNPNLKLMLIADLYVSVVVYDLGGNDPSTIH